MNEASSPTNDSTDEQFSREVDAGTETPFQKSVRTKFEQYLSVITDESATQDLRKEALNNMRQLYSDAKDAKLEGLALRIQTLVHRIKI
jgi:hypothetical protein